MADNEVSVRFSADTSKLKAGVADGTAAIVGFANKSVAAASGLDTLNDALKVASDTASTFGAAIRDVAVTTAAIVYVSKEAAEATATLTGSIVSATAASYRFTDSLTNTAVMDAGAAIDTAAGAFLNYFTSAAYAERGARLFVQANSGIRASIGQAIIGIEQFSDRMKLAFSDIPKTEFAGIAAAGGLDKFMAAVNDGNGLGTAKQTLVDFTAELMKIPGVTDQAAASIETMLATIPNYSTSSNDILISLLQTISKTGDEAVANAQKLTAAFSDGANGGKILGDLTGQLGNLEDIQVLATRIARTLQPDQAAAYFDTIISKLRQQSALQQATVDSNVAALQRIPIVGNLMVATIQDQIDKQKEFAAAVTVATANLQLQKNAADAITRAQQSEVDYQKVLNSDTAQSAKLAEAQANIATLQSRQRRSGADGDAVPVGDARDLVIRTLIGEAANQGDGGMEAVFAVIKNRVDSAYKGATSYRDVVTAPRQFSTWNPGDAAGAMASSVSKDSDIYKRAGAIVDDGASPDWSDPTGGATSYYNPKLAKPSWGSTMTNQTNVGDQVFGNTPGSPPVGADDQADVTERLQEQYDTIRKINDEKRGGTEADVAAIAIAEKNATSTKDEVADAQQLLAAKKADLAATQGGSPAAVLAAQKAVADAEQTLRDKSVAQEKAADDLKASYAREGSQQRLDATIAGLDAEQARVAKGSEAWDTLEKQKYEATKTFNDQQVADAAEVENAKFDAVQRGFKEQQDQLKEDAKVKGLSSAQELTALQELLTKEEAAERAHYQALETLYANNPQEYRKAAEQLAEVDAKTNQERLAASRSYNEQIQESYKSTFEQIGSTVSSSLTQIVEGTGTFKGLMQAVARQLVSMFIQSNVQIAADWLAKQTAGVAVAVSAEAAKTTAVATGEAARTGLVGAGAAVQTAQITVGVVKNIIASAAEAFAGVFGFLAPIMGPAAAGPAAAVQATVSSVASFAVGSWALPSDMTAQVHKGEMIVPAAATPWAQSLMANATSGGAGAGNSGSAGAQAHAHFHVTAMDSRDVRRFFGDNAKHIMSAINDGIKSGSHLGFTKLRGAGV